MEEIPDGLAHIKKNRVTGEIPEISARGCFTRWSSKGRIREGMLIPIIAEQIKLEMTVQMTSSI